MVDVATVALTAETAGLVKAEGAMDRVTAKAGKVDAAAKKLTASTKTLSAASSVAAADLTKQAAAADRVEGSVVRAAGGMGRMGQSARQVSMQMSQVVQQSMATGNVMQALSIQLPDIALAFGGVGFAIAGMAAGIAASLIPSLIGATDQMSQTKDMTDALAAATNRYIDSSEALIVPLGELAEKYGQLADEVQRAMENQARADLNNVAATAQQQAQSLLAVMTEMRTFTTNEEGPFGPITEDVRVLTDSFGIAGESASELIRGLEAVAAARGPEETAQAALQLQAALDGARNSAGQLPPELESIYSWASQIVMTSAEIAPKIMSAADAANALSGAAGAAANQVGLISAAASEAAGWMYAAASAFNALKVAATVPGGLARQGDDGRGGQREQQVSGGQFISSQANAGWRRAASGAGASGGGGSGGGSSAASEAEKEAQAVEKVTKALQDQIAAVGQSDLARRTNQELQKAGVDIYSKEGQAIADLTEKLYQMEEAHKRASEISKMLADGIEDIFVAALSGADAAREAASKLLIELGRLLIHQAFQQMFKSIGGGGGFLAGLFGGARASGGPVEAGVPYLVNENTPRSEVFVPSKSGAVLNVPQAQKALGQGGGTQVNVMAVNDYPSAAREFRRMMRNDPGVESDIAEILKRLGK